MSEISASVTRGYTFVADAENKIHITKDRLNDLGVPVVTVPLTDTIVTADIKDAQVTAAKMSSALQAQLPIVETTVGTISGDKIDVNVQVKLAAGANPVDLKYMLNCWLTTASDIGGLVATAPNVGFSVVTSGIELTSLVTNKRLEVLTTDAGLATLRIEDTGSYVCYLNVEVAGIIYTSGIISIS